MNTTLEYYLLVNFSFLTINKVYTVNSTGGKHNLFILPFFIHAENSLFSN